jgi:hypothetical protein
MFSNPIKHIKYNFTFDLFQKRSINPFYESLVNLTNNKEVLNKCNKTTGLKSFAIHEVKFIPSFFSLSLNILDTHYKIFKYKRIDNFKIDLDGFLNSNEYLKNVMTSKQRKQLKSKTRRLETCFKISYRFYFGEISETDYKLLFGELKNLIERRFNQRGDKFFLEDNWNYLIEETYDLIIGKKASFSVIYNKEKPISISLNYHFQNITQSYISSYDIDYSKFGLGHIALLKKLEWCFANNIKILDLMWGKVSHKVLWSNSITKYEHHLIYKNNQILKTAYVQLVITLYKIKDSTVLRNILKSYQKIKRSFTHSLNKSSTKKNMGYEIASSLQKPLKDKITKINIHTNEYAFLRKPVYDFQYLNSETSDTVQAFKENSENNSYLIQGLNSHIKVLVNHN